MTTEYSIFRKLGITTIVAVYILILVGGIVRSTGSGMGCPDWPKCFGNWVPPTSITELPTDYKEVYSEKRRAKNLRIASVLESMGFTELAVKIAHDESIYTELDFNPVKTWIEYVNRIVGVLIGFFIFLVLVYSFPYLKSDKSIFYLSLLSFVLVGFEGWLGSIVVSTNLLPFTITIHMVVALILVCLLIYVVVKSQKESISNIKIGNLNRIISVTVILFMATLVQIVLGTQVREAVDHIAMVIADRNEWVSHLGVSFLVHRSFSILLLGLCAYLFYLITKSVNKDSVLYKTTVWMSVLVIAEIITGINLNYMGYSAIVQPVHLTLGTIILGLQFYIYIIINFNKKYNIA
ncbi:MAG TPA: COX15/CtaA family protein [Cytophagaceae bacterium]